MDSALTIIVLGLSVLSGMLGIGVAFAAVPFLSLHLPDLVNQVQPLSLILNGVTALFSLLGFAQAGFVDWRRGSILAGVTTLSAPIGAYSAGLVSPLFIWTAYFIAVLYLCWRLIRPQIRSTDQEHVGLALWLAVPISIGTGFIGVGPGFLLMPALMMAGFSARNAAGMNALAVTPSSFSAVVPHWAHMRVDPALMVPLLVAGAVGSLVGARLASRQIPEAHLRRVLLVVVVIATLYRLVKLIV